MLGLATLGFALCFWAWALLSPLAVSFTAALHLTPFQQALLVAVPGGRRLAGPHPGRCAHRPLRRPGDVPDRLRGRPSSRSCSSASSATPAWPRCWSVASSSASPVRRSRSASRSSTPGSRLSGAGFAIGIFGAGMGGTAISALTTVKLVNAHVGEQAPFLITAVVLAVYARRRLAGPARRPGPGRARPTSLVSRLGGQRPAADHLAGLHPLRGRVRWLRRLLASTCPPTSRPPTASPRRTRRTGWPASWSSRSSCGRSAAGSPTGFGRDPGADGRLRRGRRVRRASRPAPRRCTASARSRSWPWPPPSAPAAGPRSP